MIKTIHYCWFGKEKPDIVKRNVEHWAQLNPDFEICEWNESNIDVSSYAFGERALEEKKWGFLADIIRLQKLIEVGGFYLDADVELIRPLTTLDVSKNENKLIMGYMYPCALGTAVLYSPPQHPYLKSILKSYNYIKENTWPVNNTIFTAYFINKVPGFLLTGKEWSNDLCHLYPKEFFEQPAFIKKNGISIHHCCGSWQQALSSQFSFTSQLHGLAHFLKWASRKRRVWQALRRNEFAPCYNAACKRTVLPFDISNLYTIANPYI